MKAGNFLLNLEYEGDSQYADINTNISTWEIPDMVHHALANFRTIDYNMIKLIKYQCRNYEIIIRQINRITNKSIYHWKCTYKQIGTTEPIYTP